MLDGENIKNLKVEWLRSQIGLISQEPALFSSSIKDNILYGRSASLDDVEEAAKSARAHALSLEKKIKESVEMIIISLKRPT